MTDGTQVPQFPVGMPTLRDFDSNFIAGAFMNAVLHYSGPTRTDRVEHSVESVDRPTDASLECSKPFDTFEIVGELDNDNASTRRDDNDLV